MKVVEQFDKEVSLPTDIVAALALMPTGGGVTWRGQGYTVIRSDGNVIYVKKELL